MDEMDRISPLPDCLLHFILSFLTTKESIITSVLSKRWINVWKSVPRLDLNFSDFNQPGDFETFVNSILHYKIFPNPEQLDTFNLTWHNCDESSYQAIKTWIYNLPSLHPREVYLDVSKLSGVYFVSYLFNCPSLESLFLWAQIDAWAGIDPPVVHLPFLKSLNIGWVSLEDAFMQRLINGCPVLEDLVFENCFLGVTQRIVSASLKTLVIKDTVFGQDTRLIISMPNLEYLLCQVHLGRVSFENLSSLEYASVNLWGMKNDYDGREVKLLRGLSNANSLQFSGYFVNHMMEKEAPNLPVFKNLECLDLASFTIREDLEPIDLFLRRTPNLEKLILQNISMTRHGVLCWSARFPGIRCDNLKTVEIVCLKSDREMHQLVKYLPVHLKAIENISINRTDAINDYAPHLPMQEDSP